MAIKFKRPSILVALSFAVLVTSNCKQRDSLEASTKNEGPASSGPGFALSKHALESEFSTGEDQLVLGLAAQIKSKIKTFRDAHPKAHACAYNAKLTINSKLDSGFRHGVFATPGRTLHSIVRFSSGSSNPLADDKERGPQGMAVKILLSGSETNLVQEIPGEVFHTQSDTPKDLKMEDNRKIAAKDFYKTFDIISINGLSEFVVNDLPN